MRSAEPGTAPATSKGHGSTSRGPAAQSPSFRGRPGGGSKAASKDPAGTGGLPPLGAVTTCSERSAITLANETASVPCRGWKYSSNARRRASFANCTRADGLLSLVGAAGRRRGPFLTEHRMCFPALRPDNTTEPAIRLSFLGDENPSTQRVQHN